MPPSDTRNAGDEGTKNPDLEMSSSIIEGDEKMKWQQKENVNFVGPPDRGFVMIALSFL